MNESCENCPIGGLLKMRDDIVRKERHAQRINQRDLENSTFRDRFNDRRAKILQYLRGNQLVIDIWKDLPIDSEHVTACTGPFERSGPDESLERVCGALVMDRVADDFTDIAPIKLVEG